MYYFQLNKDGFFNIIVLKYVQYILGNVKI